MDTDAYRQLLDDLRFESEQLVTHLRALSDDQWGLDTPAEGWTIHDQITHLAYFDDATTMALQRPTDFRTFADELMAGGMDFPDRIAREHRSLSPARALEWLTTSRAELLDALATAGPKARLPWFGPDMSAASSATARLMETWAHGQDIYDTLGTEHPECPGLRSIAHLGVATFSFTHRLHGVGIPTESVYVTLEAPDGGIWTWGPLGSANTVTGAALDFVLVATQRRHWSETGLVAVGEVAQNWLAIAQAFAGAPSRRERKVSS